MLGCAHNSSVERSPAIQETKDSPKAEPISEQSSVVSQNEQSGPSEETDDFNFLDEDEEDQQEFHIADPIEPWNRAMYHVNDKFFLYLAEPVAKGYRAAVPYDFRLMFSNFFKNVATPVRFVSSVLQGDVNKAGSELGSFAINTTLGVFGFGNPAEEVYGISRTEEDLGQTLAKWGIGHGFYVVWPVFGPSSVRDSITFVGDYYLHPISYIDDFGFAEVFGIGAFWYINGLSFRIGDYEALKGFSIDPYVAIRNAYVQRRAKEVDK